MAKIGIMKKVAEKSKDGPEYELANPVYVTFAPWLLSVETYERTPLCPPDKSVPMATKIAKMLISAKIVVSLNPNLALPMFIPSKIR